MIRYIKIILHTVAIINNSMINYSLINYSLIFLEIVQLHK